MKIARSATPSGLFFNEDSAKSSVMKFAAFEEFDDVEQVFADGEEIFAQKFARRREIGHHDAHEAAVDRRFVALKAVFEHEAVLRLLP